MGSKLRGRVFAKRELAFIDVLRKFTWKRIIGTTFSVGKLFTPRINTPPKNHKPTKIHACGLDHPRAGMNAWLDRIFRMELNVLKVLFPNV